MNKYLLVIVLALSAVFGHAQSPSRIFSPYSQQGIGEIKSDFYTRNFGMANIGISNYDKYSANMLNPALLEKNKYTIFDVNLGYNQSNLTFDTSLNIQGGGGLKALAVVMPISYKWTTAFSLTPLSDVFYTANGYTLVNNDTLLNAERMEGSIQRMGWSNGFTVAKGLNFGFGAGYNFGNKKTENRSALTNGNTNLIRHSSTADISGFDYELGVSYSKVINLSKIDSNQVLEKQTVYKLNNKIIKKISKLSADEIAKLDTITQDVPIKSRKYKIDLGATYNGAPKWNKLTVRRNEFVNDSSYALTYSDTINGNILMPEGFGFGITVGNMNELSSWKLSIESTFKQWAKAKEDDVSMSLPNMSRYAVGFEYTPVVNSYKNGVKGFMERTTYRTGLYQKKSIYVVNGTQLEEVGMHFGISFIERQKRLGNRSYRWEAKDKENGFKDTRHYLSRMNLGFAIGTLGANESTAIKQLFFKINFGISLNNEWFVKRKIN